MKKKVFILHLEDDLADAELIQETIESANLPSQITVAQTGDEFKKALQKNTFDIILADYRLPGYDGISALRLSKKLCPNVPFIFVSGTLGEDAAIDCLTQGATDYVLKQNLARLVPAVKGALKQTEIQRKHQQAEEAFRKSEERYRLIAENTADVIHIFNLELTPIYVSPSIERLLGYTPNEAMKLKIHDILTKKSEQEVKDLLAEQLALERIGYSDLNKPILLDLEACHKDGNTIWVELSATFIRDKDQVPTRILTVSRNINKRKEAQLQLIQSEQKFRSLAENIPDNIIRYNTEKRLIYINYSMMDSVDVDLQPFLGKKADKVEKTPKKYLDKIDKVLRTGRQEELELDVKNSNGEIRTHNIRFVSERNKNGEIIGVLAIGTDITERKRAEETLRKLSHAVEQSPAIVVITDTSGNIEYVNPRFTEVTGYSQNEVVGKNPNILQSGESRREFYKNLWDTIRAGNIWRGEFHNRKKNGELYFESASISPIYNASGKITHFMAIKEDISEHKRLEEQFRQAQKLEAIGQLAGGVAHDFNNMLGVILGYSELLLMKVDPSQVLHDEIKAIHQAALSSADLTRQLLTFARKQVILPQILMLNDTVEGMLKMLKRLISEQIKLNWKPKSDLWLIKIDPSQVNQILANLCVNSRDAIEEEGEITIETNNVIIDHDFCITHPGFTQGEYVKLSVCDNGTGIDKKNLDKIYEPFFTTKEIGKGTGLGLATVYGIVKQNNGYIDVYSEAGQGTIFKIYFPRYYSDSKHEQNQKKDTQFTSGNEKILLVEDNEKILGMTKQMLKQLGYDVLAVSSPTDALKMVRESSENIDLLITDIIMPEMNGPSLADKLVSIYPNIKCLFMSGYSGDISTYDHILNKDVNFIQKPFSMKYLSDALKRVLKGKQDKKK